MSYKAIKEAYNQILVESTEHPMIEVDGVMKHRHNSLGQPIHHTDEGIKNFHRWFGDSTTVDEHGRPKVFYHATNANFDEFNIGVPTMTHTTFGSYESSRHGIFSTPSHNFAQQYLKRGEGQNVMPLYIKATKPVDMREGIDGETINKIVNNQDSNLRHSDFYHIEPHETWQIFDDDMGEKVSSALKSHGHDSAEIVEKDNNNKLHSVIVAFHPHQIKSAIGNSGAFSHPTKITESAYDSIATSYIQMIQSKV